MKRYFSARYDEAEYADGQYVLHSDHEAALKEAVATEREEILKMLDRHKANWQKSWHGQGEVYTVLAVDTIAKAIKARGAA